MIVRIWRTDVDPERVEEYERFAQEHSLPMFKQQQGFLGALFLRSEEGFAVQTLWQDMAAVDALAQSDSYQQTVHRLQDTSLLRGEQTVEVFEQSGGALAFEALKRMFERSPHE